MSPFKITFLLQRPVVFNHFLTLDTVLAKAIYNATGDADKAISEVPLKRTQGVYHGSSIRFANPCRIVNVDYISGLRSESDVSSKNFSPDGKKYKFIDPKRDVYRNTLDVYKGVESTEAVFFGCGDIPAIEQLLPHIEGLGKKTTSGIGHFFSVSIDKISSDDSIFVSELGVMRPVPKNVMNHLGFAVGDSEWDRVTYQPPYWDLSQVEDCYVPVGFELPEVVLDLDDEF
jgi:hypothetical protein